MKRVDGIDAVKGIKAEGAYVATRRKELSELDRQPSSGLPLDEPDVTTRVWLKHYKTRYLARMVAKRG